MRGQLSLELLIIILSSVVVLSILLPQMQRIKQTSDYALASRNAQLILDKLYYSCERVQISGESETILINSLSNFSIQNLSDNLTIEFGNKSLSKPGFQCSISLNLSKGKSNITLSPGP